MMSNKTVSNEDDEVQDIQLSFYTSNLYGSCMARFLEIFEGRRVMGDYRRFLGKCGTNNL